MHQILIAIALKILEKFLSYEFVCKLLVVALEKWASSTKTDLDDKVFEAIADALGVESKPLEDLVKQAEEKLNGNNT